MLSVVLLSVIMQSVIMLSVIKSSAVVPIVVAPSWTIATFWNGDVMSCYSTCNFVTVFVGIFFGESADKVATDFKNKN